MIRIILPLPTKFCTVNEEEDAFFLLFLRKKQREGADWMEDVLCRMFTNIRRGAPNPVNFRGIIPTFEQIYYAKGCEINKV
jgi:hypothetical protein